MKNCILKGVCLFFIMIPLISAIAAIPFAAQSGHGGTTEVLARVEAPTDATQAPTQPFTEPSSSQDNSPVQTGESMIWVAMTALSLVSAMILIIGWRKSDTDRHPKPEKRKFG